MEYEVSDQDNLTSTNTFDINITGVNQGPKLDADQALSAQTTAEDTTISFSTTQLLSGFSDGDGDQLNISGLNAIVKSSGEPAGVFKFDETDQYTFTPEQDLNGEVEVRYLVSDNNGGTIQQTLTLTLTAVEDAPRQGELPTTGLSLGSAAEDHSTHNLEIVSITSDQAARHHCGLLRPR